MKEDEKSPAMPEQKRGDVSMTGQGKDTPKLTRRQKKVYDLLRTGKHSSADITIRLGYCDPRSHIAILRGKGVPVRDEWVQHKDTRFKKLWIE